MSSSASMSPARRDAAMAEGAPRRVADTLTELARLRSHYNRVRHANPLALLFAAALWAAARFEQGAFAAADLTTIAAVAGLALLAIGSNYAPWYLLRMLSRGVGKVAVVAALLLTLRLAPRGLAHGLAADGWVIAGALLTIAVISVALLWGNHEANKTDHAIKQRVWAEQVKPEPEEALAEFDLRPWDEGGV